MFKGGSIKPMIIAVLAISAIMLAFSFPYLVFAYENRMLNGYGIHYESDPVRINSDAITFSDKLRNMTTILENSSYVYMNNDSTNTSGYDARLSSNKAKSLAVEAFVDVMTTDSLLEETGFNKEGLESYLIENMDIAIGKYLLIRSDTKDMYLAWDIEMYSGVGDMSIIIDDESGKMLSMYCTVFGDDEVAKAMMDNYNDEAFGTKLAEYYGMQYLESEITSSTSRQYGGSSTNLVRYYVRDVKLMGADPDEEITIPYIVQQGYGNVFELYFNFYGMSTITLDIDETVENNYKKDYNDELDDGSDMQEVHPVTDDGTDSNNSSVNNGNTSNNSNVNTNTTNDTNDGAGDVVDVDNPTDNEEEKKTPETSTATDAEKQTTEKESGDKESNNKESSDKDSTEKESR